MSTLPRIGVVQMVSSQSVEPSLEAAGRLIARAAAQEVQAIFLPENFAALAAARPRDIGTAEATPDGPIRSFIADMARQHGVWIFAGTLPVAVRPDGAPVPDNRVRAASFVVDAHGHEVARYDKIHMFDVSVPDRQKTYLESATFEPGEDIVLVDSPVGRVGLSVCYDVRFPELYRRLFIAGATLITVPSAFTRVTGEAHFQLLVRARAVENSAFVVAACQGGIHNSGRETWGHSVVVDPWGRILGELGEGEDVLVVELDPAAQAQLRQDMPFISQRRLCLGEDG